MNLQSPWTTKGIAKSSKRKQKLSGREKAFKINYTNAYLKL